MTSPHFPYGVSVTLIRRVLNGLDEFGNDVYRDEPEVISNCVVSPGGTTEVTQFTDQVTRGVVVYFPYGTAISPLDAVVVDGVQYEVDGEPTEWHRSPFSGHVSPIEVRASEIKGASI